MINEIKITVEPSKIQAVTEIIQDGLKNFNESKVGAYDRKPFSVYIVDDNENINGGISGNILDDACYVQTLWISEKQRKKGLGTKLMQKLETYARSNQCRFIQLGTTEFQAKQFYERLGFSIVATLFDDFKGYTSYFMRKVLV